MKAAHFVSASCRGEECRCGAPATHKVGEEIPHDDPAPIRHGLTAYICCGCFAHLMGPVAYRRCFPDPLAPEGRSGQVLTAGDGTLGWRDKTEPDPPEPNTLESMGGGGVFEKF